MPASRIDFASSMPWWKQMVADMRRRFAEGEFTAGAQLPSSPALEYDYGLSRDTVRRAMYELRDLGYVTMRKGEAWRASDPLPGAGEPELLLLPPGADVWFAEATAEERQAHGLPRGAAMVFVHHRAVTRAYPVSRVRFKVAWREPGASGVTSSESDHGQ